MPKKDMINKMKQKGILPNAPLINPGAVVVDSRSFDLASDAEKQQIAKMRESMTYWKDAMRRFSQNRMAMVSFIIIVLIALLAIIGPMVMPYAYDEQIRGAERQAPSLAHWMGTDSLGRDEFVRVLMGTRISLSIGIVAAAIILVIGTIYGAVSGYIGGMTDNVMMRIVDILNVIPSMLIVILLGVALQQPLKEFLDKTPFASLKSIGSSMLSMYITFALLYWVGMARVVRGDILKLKSLEYITAAQAMGASGKHIIFKHLIPNCLSSVIVTATFAIPSAIFTESFLSFIGLGVSAPMASLGSLASDAVNGLTSYPYLLIFPALMISIIILAFNQIGDGLRDALDPKLRS